MTASYAKMRDQEKADYLELINSLIQESKHSAFHYEILAFYRQQGIDTKGLEDRIAELRKALYEIV